MAGYGVAQAYEVGLMALLGNFDQKKAQTQGLGF